MDNFGIGKTILLGMPDWFLYDKLKKELEILGFEVIGIPFTEKFKYKNFNDRAYNFIRKVFLRDKKYKAYLKYRDTGRAITTKLNRLTKRVDYALLLRADYYPKEIVELIKQKANSLIGYQWDGLNRFPSIDDLIPLFDRFFVFDPNDLSRPNALPATNFYFEGDYDRVTQNIDVYYLANFVRSRIKKIQSLSAYLREINARSVIKIISNKKKIVEKNSHYDFEILSDYIPYEENLSLVSRAKILVDILHGVHYGLSFRVFEAIGDDKKLITDNKEIVKYDFYNPKNIFVIQDEEYVGLEEFINSPYCPLEEKLKSKYSFHNWLRYVLDIQPYQSIQLPK
ncbi:hypothetical protein [Sphingobacterium sp. LRF_L2]|uniref:hypothetical protein n=1 Tax=Sphingobacterium sp. LRF_L2 TaxID=3369421 RepID=UPI003F5D6C8A